MAKTKYDPDRTSQENPEQYSEFMETTIKKTKVNTDLSEDQTNVPGDKKPIKETKIKPSENNKKP